MEVSFRWRKASAADREHPLFELLRDNEPLLDIGYSDSLRLEVCLNQAATGWLIEFERLIELLEQGKSLADQELT